MKILLALWLVGIPLCLHAKTIHLLTYNTWGLELGPIEMSSAVGTRFEQIIESLGHSSYDLICLQEVWSDLRKRQLKKMLKKRGYKYLYYEKKPLFSGLVPQWKGLYGNGLFIASKIPFKVHSSLSFSIPTRPSEYFSKKGTQHIELLEGGKAFADLYNTHFGSVSFDSKNWTFKKEEFEKRRTQLEEYIHFIQTTHQTNSLILAGDFNFHEKEFDFNAKKFDENLPSIEWLKIRSELGLNDSTEGEDLYSYSSHNPWLNDSNLRFPSEKLDYLFFSKNIRVISSSLSFDGLAFPVLSDHYGVEALIELN